MDIAAKEIIITEEDAKRGHVEYTDHLGKTHQIKIHPVPGEIIKVPVVKDK